jgi:hypothetical protein
LTNSLSVKCKPIIVDFFSVHDKESPYNAVLPTFLFSVSELLFAVARTNALSLYKASGGESPGWSYVITFFLGLFI